MGSMTKDGDIVVGGDSKSKLWKEVDFRKAMQKLEHELCRRCEGSRVSVESIHSNERPANHMNIK